MAVRIGKCDIPNLSDIVESTFDNVMSPEFIYGNNFEFEPVDTDFDFDDDFDEEIE